MERIIAGPGKDCALRIILMTVALSLSACFDDKKTDPPPVESFTLAVSVTGSGNVTSNPAGIDCGSDCTETLSAESTITLNVTPASGFTFTGWGGDCSGNTSSCTLTMSASRAVTASFTTNPPPPAAQYTLSVSVTGTGSVSSTPAGISCGADCTENYTDGTSVTLTATAGTGFQFSSWGGACSGTGNCVVAMTEARSVTATFAPNQYGLTVQVSGTGTISSSPAGISCGSDCTENYNYGTSVTLTAAPGANQQFSGWANACSGTQLTCTVAMSAARSVSASFTPLLRALTVTLNGTGSVTSAPAGINCGTDCSENYAHGSNVTLTASPGMNQQFSGWLGACSGTQTTCTVAMTEARSVTAAFAPASTDQFTLTISVTGTGTITSSPVGINCGTDCTESYASGQNVTLTATAGSGFQFSSWGGACGGSGTCVVAMNMYQAVTATFVNSATQILFQDSFESGDRSTTQNGIRWLLPGGNISVNTLNPHTGTYAMEFLFRGKPDGQDSTAEQRIELNASYTDMWFMFDLYVPANFYHRTQAGAANNKFFAIYRNPYTNPGFQVNFSTQPNGSGGSNLEIHLQNNGREAPPQSPASGRNFLTSTDAGRWHSIILHVKVPTDQNSNDGVMQLWKNGNQMVNLTNLASWGGIDENYFDAAYILGWSNSGYASDTLFYVDNFFISNAPLIKAIP